MKWNEMYTNEDIYNIYIHVTLTLCWGYTAHFLAARWDGYHQFHLHLLSSTQLCLAVCFHYLPRYNPALNWPHSTAEHSQFDSHLCWELAKHFKHRHEARISHLFFQKVGLLYISIRCSSCPLTSLQSLRFTYLKNVSCALVNYTK